MQIRFPPPLSWNNAFLSSYPSSAFLQSFIYGMTRSHISLSMEAALSLGNYPPTLLEKEEISMKMRLSDRLLSLFEYNLRHDYAQHPEKKPSRRRIILLCDIISRVSYPKLFPTFSEISRWIYISFHTRKITT